MAINKFTIYTDGASRGNPGPASYGFIIFNDRNEVVFKKGKYIGTNTNNFAEYSAVLESLKYLEKLGNLDKTTLEFYMDSKLVVEQLSGRFKVKSQTLKPLIEQINQIKAPFTKAIFIHIPREKNKLADKLANEALDSR